jgi:hypothetical protein
MSTVRVTLAGVSANRLIPLPAKRSERSEELGEGWREVYTGIWNAMIVSVP